MNKIILKMVFATTTLLQSLVFMDQKCQGELILGFGRDGITASGPVSLIEGSAAQLDLYLRSSSPINLEQLYSFSAVVDITPTSGGLRFNSVQSNSQLFNTDYVFAGNSSKAKSGAVYGTVSPNGLRFSASDTFETASQAAQVSATNELLLRLDLSPLAPGNYSIALHQTTSQFLRSDFSSIAFSSTPGQLSVSAVPEPGSLALLGAVSAIYGISRRTWVRRRATRL